MADNHNFKCSGNCLNCMPAQRAYCASQHAYSNMKVLDSMMGIVIGMQGDIKNLAEKIEAIQNSEAHVFDPTESSVLGGSAVETSPIAQEGSGATE